MRSPKTRISSFASRTQATEMFVDVSEFGHGSIDPSPDPLPFMFDVLSGKRNSTPERFGGAIACGG